MIQFCPFICCVTLSTTLNILLIFKGNVLIYAHDHAIQTPTLHLTFQAGSACYLLQNLKTEANPFENTKEIWEPKFYSNSPQASFNGA